MKPTQTGRSVADIDPARRTALDAGLVEAATLTECLAVDFGALMRAAIPRLDMSAFEAMDRAGGLGISKRMALACELLRDRLAAEAASELRHHTSDTVRGWAGFLVGQAPDMALPDRLAAIRPFADDHHFGVREWAWMAVRPHLAAELDRAVALLAAWTSEPSERLRRFASEATRPRGVWCAHIDELKREPEGALAILAPLRADPSPYVQDSVGNWLNDAAKTRPGWVRDLCRDWTDQSPVPATARICKRALRSIGAA